MGKHNSNPVRPNHPSIERARTIANLMDSAFTIPIIRKKIGLDPLLGLLPVSGDVISALFGVYMLWVAVELRLPKPILARMGANLIVDILLGVIPIVGDIADAMWKSNQMNFKLLDEAYQKHGIGPEYRSAAGVPTVDVIAEPAAQ
jgi:hypothetical protein